MFPSPNRYLNVLNPLKIARHYELNIMHPDERRLIKILLVSYDTIHWVRVTYHKILGYLGGALPPRGPGTTPGADAAGNPANTAGRLRRQVVWSA